MTKRVILIIGTADTKSDELLFLKSCVEAAGAIPAVMDVGILGTPSFEPDYSKHDVAAAANTTNEAIIALGNENLAMTRQAEGAALLAQSLQQSGKIDGVLAIGGTMATDLALDVVAALPLGFPKLIASTVAYSPLLSPDRISADVMMILWSGGLYGLNPICQSILKQAASAIVGACQFSTPFVAERPIVGISSLGKSSLKYMVELKPELEHRGYDVAVFHATGMGGRAMESMLAKGALVAVLDFCLVEVSNHQLGSVVSAGNERLQGAGKHGIPQIVAPGGVTLVDFQSWNAPHQLLREREIHVHNRLISSAILTKEEKENAAKTIAEKLNQAVGPIALIMPLQGIDEWDRDGQPFRDPDGLAAFSQTIEAELSTAVEYHPLDHHINDSRFTEKALEIFDRWTNDGLIVPGKH